MAWIHPLTRCASMAIFRPSHVSRLGCRPYFCLGCWPAHQEQTIRHASEKSKCLSEDSRHPSDKSKHPSDFSRLLRYQADNSKH